MGNSASKSASSRGDITSKKKTNIKRKQFQQIESSGDVEAQERSSISATTTAEQHPTTADAHEDESPHNTHDSTEVSGRIRPDGQDKHLSRSLSQRHIQMMALAGAIGTGLFLSLGGALQTGGPLGALLGYGLVGLVVCVLQFALGEVSVMWPVTGAYVQHAEILVDPALGFAVGWNVVFCNMMSVPSEITASLVMIQYWTDKHAALIITSLIILTFVIGIIGVGMYGEVEFVMTLLKIALVIGIVIMGLVIDLGGVSGHDPIGFRYWNDPGPFVEYLTPGNWGKFLGFWAVMNNAIYSFAGVENITIVAAETKNPRHNIPKACKKVFARVIFFFLITVFVIGMIVPSNDPALDNKAGNPAESPFVIVATRVGIKGIPAFINAMILTSAWSSANEAIISGTRVIYGLAVEEKAPRIFTKTTPWGSPYCAVLLQTSVACLSYIALSSGALKVFYYFLDMTASSTLVSWIIILFNHIRFRQAVKLHDKDVTDSNKRIEGKLPWSHWWTPYASPVALGLSMSFLLTGGFAVFVPGHWDTGTFISAYLDILIVLLFYGGWKYSKQTGFQKLESIPIEEALKVKDEIDQAEHQPATGWAKYNILWG